MKSIELIVVATTFLELLYIASTSYSLSFPCTDDSDYQAGATENLDVIDANDMQRRYDIHKSINGIEVPGPGFDLLPDAKFPLLETNPVNSDFTRDLDDMNWLLLNNPKLIPNTGDF